MLATSVSNAVGQGAALPLELEDPFFYTAWG